jgi:uncharacterized secreted protein with C-terminal beta-propeller domain
MKKRSMWLLFAAVISILILTFAFFIDKVTVTASPVALSDQGWKANFSSPLKDSAIENGALYLVDQQGNEPEATITMTNKNRTLEVTGLVPGIYKLHMKREALQGGFFKNIAINELSFTVQKELQTVKSEKELKDYFDKIEKMTALNNERDFGEAETTMDSKGSGEAVGGEVEYSTTNNQVEGIDESDSVKTDGSYIYAAIDGRVVITDVRNPASMEIVSEIPRDETYFPNQLFLHEDTLIVLGDKHVPPDYTDTTHSDDRMMLPFSSSTNVRFYDIQDAKSPKLIREIGSEGYLNGARKKENMLYFVTNVASYFRMYSEIEDQDLRPYTYDSEKGDKASPLPYSDLSILPGTLDASYSVITAMDLNNPKESKISTKGYLGSSHSLYMSKEALYLTAPIYLPAETKNNNSATDMMWNPQESNTEIYKFSLDGTNVKFVSSVEVKGSLLNQFSMNEYNGYFRVVTTNGIAWNEETPSENNLFILDSGMKQVGSLEGLAEGERIYSARFMGDKAYMVTFKETDPLFVMDISNPSSPKVLGELKVPGFSNYLHPLDDTHLIGFGYDVFSKDVGNGQEVIMTGGMKISLFDVSDLANPIEKDVAIVGEQGTYSPLQYDHKALFQHQETNLFGFPITVYEATKDGYGEYAAQGALVYEITAEKGIQEVGNMIQAKNPDYPYEEWEKSVQRMLYVGDYLYTISMEEIRSYDLKTFKEVGVISY